MRICLLFFFSTWLVLASGQTYTARLTTNFGSIEISLYDGTPKHRDNFIRLIETGYYDSLLFHRVIRGFVIQAGDPDSRNAKPNTPLGDGDLGYQLPAEIFPNKYIHKRGAVGMARDDNPQKASSACQFYIVQGKSANDSVFYKAKQRTNGYVIPDSCKEVYRAIGGIPHLDSRYTVFGEVTKGMEVVDSIAAQTTDTSDRPLSNVYLLEAQITGKVKTMPFRDQDNLLQGIWQSDSDTNVYMIFDKGKLYNYYHMNDGENVYTESAYFLADNCIAETDKNIKGITFLIVRYEKMVQCSELKSISKNSFACMDAASGKTFTMHRQKKIPRK